MIGSKYNEVQHQPVTAIAKLMRADVKAAIKADKMPNVKVSVKCRHYNCIDISIIDSKGLEMHNLNFDYRAHFQSPEAQRLTEIGEQVQTVLKEIHDSYNYDHSDSMTDYFDVNYYGSVSI